MLPYGFKETLNLDILERCTNPKAVNVFPVS